MNGTPVINLPRAVLFDWDNTLIDSWTTIHEAMNTTLVAMGQNAWTIDQTRERVRRSLREVFPEMFGDRWEEAREVFYERFRDIHLDMLSPSQSLVLKMASVVDADSFSERDVQHHMP